MTVAVLDACVLYSASLRDFFMWLAVGLVYQPKWTEDIHREWIENVLENRPELSREALERTRDLMNQWGGDWQCIGYASLLPTLALSDPGDTHVLAAAIASQAPYLVTFNLSDFPEPALAPHGVRALHPDAFALLLLAESPDLVCDAIRRHRATLKSPPKTAREYLDRLERCGLPGAAARLRDMSL